MDPESLVAINIMYLSEHASWEQPLTQVMQLISDIRKNNGLLLDPPYTQLSESIIFVSIPEVVKKCLELPNCTAHNYQHVITFLYAAILLARDTFRVKNSAQLVPLLNSIVDDAQVFHINRVIRNQTALLCQYMVQNKIPDALLSLFSSDNFEIEDLVGSVSLFHRIFTAVGRDNLFTDYQSSLRIICEKLQELSIIDDERKIPFKQVLEIIRLLINIDVGEAVRNSLIDIMMSFLEIDIIDIKLSGIKIGVILFTKVISAEALSEPENSGIFTFLLSQTNSNLEALTLLQPALIKFIETNSINQEIVDTFYDSISNVPPSVIQKAYSLFSDFALKTKPESEAINFILQKVLSPPNIDILSKLVIGPQFQKAALDELFNLAEKEHNSLALEALMKVASLVDLTNYVPTIFENISNVAFFKDHVLLIEKLLKKAMVRFDASKITSVLANNIQTFSLNEITEIMKPLSEILRATDQKIPKDDLILIFDNAQNNDCLIIVIEYLFSERYELITSDSTQVLVSLINRASQSLELFPILQHLYLADRNVELKNAVFESLLHAILNPINEAQRIEVSQLLLTINNSYDIPAKLCKYVQLCLDALLETANLNAALFINECLSFASRYVLIEKFHLERHRFIVPEDLVTVNIDIPKSEIGHLQVSINSQSNVAYLVTVISAKIERDVTSIILYSKGKSVPVQTRILDTDLNFEVRFKAEYERVPPFTLENHPVSLFNNEKYIDRLLELLDSEIGEQIYNILIDIPTPKDFSISKLGIDPSKPYLFLYELHFLAKHLNELSDKAGIQSLFEQIICDRFETIVPEARYLLLLLLDSNTKDERLVTKVMYTLCIEKTPCYFVRIMRKLWSIVTNFEIDLDQDVLKAIIFKENAKFNELAMKSHLIQTQKFDKIWSIFKNCDDENKLKHVKIFTMINIPAEFYQDIFNVLLPLFNHLDESILAVFAELSEKWPEFPPETIANVLIDSYIKCTNKPQSISENPFKLILSIMENDEKTRNEIIEQLTQTIPPVLDWNYTPTDSFKCNDKCGLSNLGATCYVNAVLQQIFNIEPIRNFIISSPSFIDQSMQALHVLFTKMMYSQRKYIDMNDFAGNWTGWDGSPINAKEQQDANEFLMLLFSRLEIYPDAYQLISGDSETVFINKSTNETVSVQKTSFTNLPLIVAGQNSIEESMKLTNIPEIIENYKVDDKSPPISVESRNIIDSLPPYLFIQLKRFDYSIETQTRIKIDQKYEFEDVFDFKNYVKYSGETRYRLIGVVLHQGDVDVGHYFSYTRLNDNQWLCLNDTGVSIVCDNIMKNETYGSPTTGSTGYILVYERFNASELPKVPLNPDPALLQEIHKDNLRLIVNSVYFTPYFANFVESMITHLDFTDDSINNCVFKYTLNSLVHSSLVQPFNNIIEALIQKIKESEKVDESFGNYLQNEMDIIIEIMTQCTNKSIKLSFSNLISEFIKLQKAESALIIIIASQMADWYPIILSNWRNGFDFFKIFADFASIDQDCRAYLIELGIVDDIYSFVQNDFKPFVDNKENKITLERFTRLIDMTWIFNLFRITQLPLQNIIKPSFIKWCLASEKHCPALLELIKPEIPNLERIAEQSKAQISEPLIATLVIDSPTPFIIPKSWCNKYLHKQAARDHVFRAITDMIGFNFDLFDKFSKQKELFKHFLMKTEESSDDNIIFLKTLEDHIRDDQSDGELNLRFYAVTLFSFVEYTPEMSQKLYNKNKEFLNKKAAKPDQFAYLPFLDYLTELSARIANLKDHVSVVSKALHAILQFNPRFDEHAVRLATIGCTMMRDENIKIINEQFVADIELTISKMYDPEHKLLQSLLRSLFLGLIVQYNNSQIPTACLLPNDPIALSVCQAAVSRESKPLKNPAIDLLKINAKRYATASRALKFLFVNIPANCDISSCYEILSEYSLEVLMSNLPYLERNEEALFLLVTQFYQIKDKINVMNKMAQFLASLGEKLPQKVKNAASINMYKAQMNNLCRFCADERNNLKNRSPALNVIRVWLEFAQIDPYETLNGLILNHFHLDETQEDQEIVDKFTVALIKANKSVKSVHDNLCDELMNSFNLANVGDARLNTLNSLAVFVDDEFLLHEFVEKKLLQKIWSMKYKNPNDPLNALTQLAMKSKPYWNENTAQELRDICNQSNSQPSSRMLLNIIENTV